MPALNIELGSPASQHQHQLILLLISFPVTKCRSDMNMLVFFLGKCVLTAAKTLIVDRKNQKALALLYLASRSLPNAAKSGVVPTEFAVLESSKANFLTCTFRLPQKDN